MNEKVQDKADPVFLQNANILNFSPTFSKDMKKFSERLLASDNEQNFIFVSSQTELIIQMFTSAMTLRLCTEIMQQSSFNEKTFEAYNEEKKFNGSSSERSSTLFYYVKKRIFSELFFLNPHN